MIQEDTFTTNGYKKIDDFIRNIEKQSLIPNITVLGYPKDAVNKRLSQKITAMITDPYLREAIGYCRSSGGEFPDFKDGMNLAGLNIRTGNIVLPSAKLFIRCMGSFFLLWSYVLLQWLKSFWSRTTINEKSVMLFGVPKADLMHAESDARFVKFVEQGPIEQINNAPHICIQASDELVSTRPDRILYSRHPLLSVFVNSQSSFYDKFNFLFGHLYLLLYFPFLVIRVPLLSLLWRDIAEHAVATHLNAMERIDDVLITNQNWLQQFLWMTDLPDRSFRLHMALYSQNNAPVIYKKDSLRNVNHPSVRHLIADNVFIWHESYKDFLKRDGIHIAATVVGSILWYLPDQAVGKRRNAANFKVCVFDVTPMSAEASTASGRPANYYSAKNVMMYLTDILAVVEKLKRDLNVNITIVMKQKRSPQAVHDQAYLAFLEEACAEHNIELVAPDYNVYSLIDECDLCISIPFSSPAYVSLERNRHAIFYDPTTEIINNFPDRKGLDFIAGSDCLADKLRDFFS